MEVISSGCLVAIEKKCWCEKGFKTLCSDVLLLNLETNHTFFVLVLLSETHLKFFLSRE